MARSKIQSGVCGFETTVTATRRGRTCELSIESPCELVGKLAESLTEVEPFGEISYRGEGPVTLREAARCRLHPACPVPAGIIKTVEVACGLAVPREVRIEIEK